MTSLRILLLMIELLPLRGERDLLHRWRLAEAVSAATDNVLEQDLLVGIAKDESGFRADIATCKTRGRLGELTAWQIRRKRGDDLCRTYEADAKVALDRIRESLAECSGLADERARLAAYCSGSCTNRGGQRASRRRWVDSQKASAR